MPSPGGYRVPTLGDLRHRVQIQTRSDLPTASGQRQYSWVLFAEVWAKAEPLQGREYLAQEQRAAKVTTRFTIRFLAGVLPRMRVIWQGRWYDIQYARQVDGKRFWLEVFATELVEVPVS